MKAIIGIALAVLVLVLVVGYLVLTRPSPPLAVTVTFTGYTNDASSQRVATFGISNGCNFVVRRWGCYSPEDQRVPGLFFTYALGTNVLLAPGQSEVVAVPVPTNQGPWRAVFSCSQEGVRTTFGDWAGNSLIIPAPMRGTPVEFEMSPWVVP